MHTSFKIQQKKLKTKADRNLYMNSYFKKTFAPLVVGNNFELFTCISYYLSRKKVTIKLETILINGL